MNRRTRVITSLLIAAAGGALFGLIQDKIGTSWWYSGGFMVGIITGKVQGS